MKNEIGEIIFETRRKGDLTQDQFGNRHSISGPAVFKFEKGYVKPSLELWLAMSRDAGLSERRAILLWVKNKLPEQFQQYIELPEPDGPAAQPRAKAKVGQADYSKIESRAEMRRVFAADKSAPNGLRELLADGDVWEVYKPTGHELNMLRDVFGPLGEGTAANFREALHLIRAFSHSF